MKKISILFAAISLVFIASCKKTEPAPTEVPVDDVTLDKDTTIVVNTVTVFDINKIPVSIAALGKIPFFTLPNNVTYQNKPMQRDYDEIYFPLGTADSLDKIAGKSFKSSFIATKNSEWSMPYFLKSYDEAIKSVGGVLVFDDRLSKNQLDYLGKNASYLGEEGSIDYWNEPVKVYVIRKGNGDDIYIQLYANSASGAMQIVQKEPFKQTIVLVKADQISNDLTENGKSVLHINFDVDKATLTSSGKEAVNEILQALKNNPALNIAINGYTDNTGNAQHNLQLSTQRAEAVKNELVKAGIDAKRLTAKGFGQANPIAPNESEEGKAQNRRVELIKK